MNELLLITDLISSFLDLRKTRDKSDLQSDDWKKLEHAYFEHLSWRFEYPKRIFRQQAFSAWLITFIVVALIISGLLFSFVQLQSAITLGNLTSLQSEVTIETAGKLSLSSSIVGAVVLVISLVFFYLYLKNVFKIQYPIPPHVGFSETDIMEVLKASAKAGVNLNDILEYLKHKTNPETKSGGSTLPVKKGPSQQSKS